MYCTNCGSPLAKDSVFCDQCGHKIPAEQLNMPPASVAESTPVYSQPPAAFSVAPTDESTPAAQLPAAALCTSPPIGSGSSSNLPVLLGKNRNYIILVAGILAMIISIFFLVFNSGNAGFYRTLVKSYRCYQKEANLFVDKNPVLATAKAHLSRSYAIYLRQGDHKASIKNDAASRILALTSDLPIPFVSAESSLFFTDSRVIAGAPGLFYVEADSAALGDQLKDFSRNFGASVPGSLCYLLGSLLDDYDLSYANVSTGNLAKNKESQAKNKKNLARLCEKFVKRTHYQRSDSSIKIGDRTVSAKHVTLTANEKSLLAWAKEDLLSAAQKDDSIAKYVWLAEFIFKNHNQLSSFLPKNSSEYLTSLENEIHSFEDSISLHPIAFIADFDIYQGIIVHAEIKIKTSAMDKTLIISAVGEDYHLDDFTLALEDNNRTVLSLSAAGKHINTPVVSSAIVYRSQKRQSKLDIRWDTTQAMDNLNAQTDDTTINATFALSEGDHVFRYDSEKHSFNCKITALDHTLKAPEKTIPLSALKPDELVKYIFGSALPSFLH